MIDIPWHNLSCKLRQKDNQIGDFFEHCNHWVVPRTFQPQSDWKYPFMPSTTHCAIRASSQSSLSGCQMVLQERTNWRPTISGVKHCNNKYLRQVWLMPNQSISPKNKNCICSKDLLKRMKNGKQWTAKTEYIYIHRYGHQNHMLIMFTINTQSARNVSECMVIVRSFSSHYYWSCVAVKSNCRIWNSSAG